MRPSIRWPGRQPGRSQTRPETADRFVLILLALVALKLANAHFLTTVVPGEPGVLFGNALQFLSFLVFAALIALSCRTRLPESVRRLRLGRGAALAPVVLVLVAAAVATSIVRELPTDSLQIDDANAMAVCGAQAISAGRDPYHDREINCLQHLGLSTTLATPLRKGPLAAVPGYPTPAQIEAAVQTAIRHGGTQTLFSGLAKPPLDPVAMLPVAHSSTQVRAFWTLAGVVVFLVLLGLAAGQLWAAALLAFVATYYIPGSALTFASFGNAESFAYLLMALSVLWIRRPVVSGIALGLAIGSNELALFFFPAYLLLCLPLTGWVRRLLALGMTLVVAVVPLLIRYPDAVSTIWHNLAAPTFPLGYGPVLLVLEGVIKPPPPDLFLGLTAAAMALILIWGWRRPHWRISAGVLMLAGFWLSWRSLDEYMAQVPLLAVAAIVALLARPGAVSWLRQIDDDGSPPPGAERTVPSPGAGTTDHPPTQSPAGPGPTT